MSTSFQRIQFCLKQTMLGLLIATAISATNGTALAQSGYMPDESARHEGTWLQWPHSYTYGKQFRDEIEASWVAMTRVLVQSENVHIVAYNKKEVRRIQRRLIRDKVPMNRVDFVVRPNDDFWIRDCGPIFVYDWYCSCQWSAVRAKKKVRRQRKRNK